MRWVHKRNFYDGRVSIRARFLGRAMRSAAAATPFCASVSIRARFLGRAMLYQHTTPCGVTLFQSAPGF